MEPISNDLKKAYEQMYKAARNILELSEPCSDDDFIMHQDNYNDLAMAHQAVYLAKNK